MIRVIDFALTHKLQDIYNLTHQEVPHANGLFFNKICEQLKLPPLQFRNELKGPAKAVSVKKLQQMDFKLQYTKAEYLS